MNQACGGLPLPCWAVPVLPATLTPSIWAAVPVPSDTTASIIRVSWAATSGETAEPNDVGSVVLITDRSGARTCLTR